MGEGWGRTPLWLEQHAVARPRSVPQGKRCQPHSPPATALQDAGALSFGDDVRFEDGDVMEIVLAGFGRALRNPVRIERGKEALVTVRPL